MIKIIEDGAQVKLPPCKVAQVKQQKKHEGRSESALTLFGEEKKANRTSYRKRKWKRRQVHQSAEM